MDGLEQSALLTVYMNSVNDLLSLKKEVVSSITCD
jgi:hypothetical protein